MQFMQRLMIGVTVSSSVTFSSMINWISRHWKVNNNSLSLSQNSNLTRLFYFILTFCTSWSTNTELIICIIVSCLPTLRMLCLLEMFCCFQTFFSFAGHLISKCEVWKTSGRLFMSRNKKSCATDGRVLRRLQSEDLRMLQGQIFLHKAFIYWLWKWTASLGLLLLSDSPVRPVRKSDVIRAK